MTKEQWQQIISALLGAAIAIAAVMGWVIAPRQPQIISIQPSGAEVVMVPPGEAKVDVVLPAEQGQAEAPVLDVGAQALAGDLTNFSGGVEVDVNSSTVEGLDIDQTGSGDIAVFRDGGTAVWTLADGGGITYGGGLDLNGQTLTVDVDGDSTIGATTDDDDVITTTLGAAAGIFVVSTGNLRVGNGAPSTSLNGEDAYVEGTFEVDGAVNLDGAVDIDGNLTSATGAVTVADTINVTGAADFDSTFNADGATTLNSTLDVDGNLTSGTGAITIADTLNTTGAVDFDSTLTVDGALTIPVDVEHFGTMSVISTAITYTAAAGGSGSVATIGDGEIWLVHAVFWQTTTNFDCTGDDCTATVGDGNDADGFLVLADANMQATFTEATGYAAGFYGIENGSGGAYTLDDGGPFVYAPSGAAETIDWALAAAGNDFSAGAATIYVLYTRIL